MNDSINELINFSTSAERPRDRGHWDQFRSIVEAVNIPVIANGDVFTQEDMRILKESSGMIFNLPNTKNAVIKSVFI